MLTENRGVMSRRTREPTGWRETVLHETIYSACQPYTFTGSGSTVINGITYTSSQANVSTSAIVTGQGLVWSSTNNGTETFTSAAAGSLLNIIGQGRWRRGVWAVWTRITAINFAGTNSMHAYVPYVQVAYPDWWWVHGRARNEFGGDITSTGSWFSAATVGGGQNGARFGDGSWPGQPYPNTSLTPDVCCTLFRSPWEAESYLGTWSGGWPTLASMYCGQVFHTLSGQLSNATFCRGVNELANVGFGFGGYDTSPSTGTFTCERIRFTGYDDY